MKPTDQLRPHQVDAWLAMRANEEETGLFTLVLRFALDSEFHSPADRPLPDLFAAVNQRLAWLAHVDSWSTGAGSSEIWMYAAPRQIQRISRSVTAWLREERLHATLAWADCETMEWRPLNGDEPPDFFPLWSR